MKGSAHTRSRGCFLATWLMVAGAAGAAGAGDDLTELRELIDKQSQQLAAQAKALEQQSKQLQEQATALEQQKRQIEQLKNAAGADPSTTQAQQLQKQARALQIELLQQRLEAGQADTDAAATGLDDQAVRKIIADYLAETENENAEKKLKEDQQFREVGKDLSFKDLWRNGFTAETADKAFTFHMGGRFQYDTGFYAVPKYVQNAVGDEPNDLEQGSDFRRAMLRADGTLWSQMDWVFEVDVSRASDLRKFMDAPDTSVNFLNEWVGWHDLPLLDVVRIGHQKELLSFGSATNPNFLPFMERSYIFDAFEDDYDYDNGITTSRTYLHDRLYTWFGLFQTNTRAGAFDVQTTAKLAVDGRVCVMPIYCAEEQRWLNIGIAVSERANPNNPANGLPFNRVTVRPLVRTGSAFQVPNLIDTTNYYTRDGTQIVSVCYNQAWGPLAIGAQYEAQYNGNSFAGGLPNANGTLPSGVTPLGNLYFDGYHIEILYFLTRGDHHRIVPREPGFDRVIPVENFYLVNRHDAAGPACGLGAWEIGISYDHVNAENGVLTQLDDGGRLDSISAGLNWYLNPNAKIQWNYVFTTGFFGGAANAAGTHFGPLVDGSFHSFGMRMHFDF
jgi:phosphate-selective porin OprO/OprP